MTERISSGVARAVEGRADIGRFELGDLVEEVLRQRDQDRARAAGQRFAHGLGHGRGDVLGTPRLDRPLREATERRDLVDLLERFPAEEGALDLADEREHRARVLPGGVDADREVGAADRPRRQAGGRPARSAARAPPP